MSKKFSYYGSLSSYIFPLDTEPSLLAFGMFKLRGAYTGNCIRVRRSSDNALQNIGFDANNYIEVASLLSFVGANNGFIETWYDQSGNNRNATQTNNANQPQIVSAGSLITFNGLAEPLFSGSQTLSIADFSYTFTSTYVLNISRPRLNNIFNLVFSHYLTTGNQRSWYFHRYQNNATSNIAISQDGTTGIFRDINYAAYAANTQYMYDFQYNGSLTGANQVISHRNNIIQSATTTGSDLTSLHNSTTPLLIGGGIAGQLMDGGISNIIMIDNAPNNRSQLNTNINSLYNTY